MKADIASQDEIKNLLQKSGLTMREVSELLKMPYRTLQNYRNGYRPLARWIYELIEYRLRDYIDLENLDKVKGIPARICTGDLKMFNPVSNPPEDAKRVILACEQETGDDKEQYWWNFYHSKEYGYICTLCDIESLLDPCDPEQDIEYLKSQLADRKHKYNI